MATKTIYFGVNSKLYAPDLTINEPKLGFPLGSTVSATEGDETRQTRFTLEEFLASADQTQNPWKKVRHMGYTFDISGVEDDVTESESTFELTAKCLNSCSVTLTVLFDPDNWFCKQMWEGNFAFGAESAAPLVFVFIKDIGCASNTPATTPASFKYPFFGIAGYFTIGANVDTGIKVAEKFTITMKPTAFSSVLPYDIGSKTFICPDVVTP